MGSNLFASVCVKLARQFLQFCLLYIYYYYIVAVCKKFKSFIVSSRSSHHSRTQFFFFFVKKIQFCQIFYVNMCDKPRGVCSRCRSAEMRRRRLQIVLQIFNRRFVCGDPFCSTTTISCAISVFCTVVRTFYFFGI